MKKSLFISLSFLLSTGVTYSTVQLKKQLPVKKFPIKIMRDNVIFSDDFESYAEGDDFASPGGWTMSKMGQGSDGYVTDDLAHSGTKSVYLAAPEKNSRVDCKWYGQDIQYTQLNHIEIWVFPEQNDVQLTALKAAYSAGGQWGGGGAFGAIQFWPNGKLGYADGINGNVMLDKTWTAGRWYHIKMVLDHSTKRWEFFMDDELIATNLGFMNSYIYEPNRITFSASGGSAYWDDFTYKSIPVIEPRLP